LTTEGTGALTGLTTYGLGSFPVANSETKTLLSLFFATNLGYSTCSAAAYGFA
jgi:hypothetical protein